MDNDKLKKILNSLKSGGLSVDSALEQLKHLPYEDIGVAKVDHHRELRHGIPEVIFAKGKRPEDIRAIAGSMLRSSGRFLITRASEAVFRDIESMCSEHEVPVEYFGKSGVIAAGGAAEKTGSAAVICAGTADIPVAEEAMATALFLGTRADAVFDVGVAGLHRLLDARDIISGANVLIVVAGMEGALPSVIGGMTDKPLIAVPTSVGYGTSLGGLTALFAMLNSCVPGIAVMNIDNGFSAGVLAHKINAMIRNNRR
ncbi:MAG: nickel pincer cofactor biosynthesis protein LarB [Deferribacteres bacterium]|nr:nickel pincer cofactor biosynthesis protein LarB [Deferribacteres bacterium]